MSRRERLTHLMFFWMAVTVLLLSAACTRGGGGGGGTPLTPPPAESPAPGQPAGNGELDNDSGKSSTDPATSTDGATGEAVPVSPDSPSAVGEEETTEPAPIDGTQQPVVVTYDPSGLEPDQVFENSRNQGVVIPGEQSDIDDFLGNDLFYTGSGQDSLREQLLERLNSRPDSAEKAADQELARAVRVQSFDVNWDSRNVRLSILMARPGKRMPIVFTGKLNNKLIFRAGSNKKKDGFSVEAACMDLNGGCHTVLIKLQERSKGRTASAYMIQRETSATLFTEGNGYNAARNPEYNRLLEILWNTVSNPGGPRAVKILKLITSETINGVSEFSIKMVMRTNRYDEQTLAWRGPLLKPSGADVMDLSIEQLPSRAYANGQAIYPKGLISDTIRDTRLIRNDGRGNLQLEVIIRKSTIAGKEDRFKLTIARIHTPVRPLRVQ